MKKLFNEAGICPYCGSDDLEYGSMEPETNNLIYYPWECNDCGHKGEEWYQLTFDGHTVENEDGDMVLVEDLNNKA